MAPSVGPTHGVQPSANGSSMTATGPWVMSWVSKIWYSPRLSAHHDTGTMM